MSINNSRNDEERRRHAEDERKARIEAEKTRREEEKRKRQLMMAGSLGGLVQSEEGAKNFVVHKGEGKGLPGQPQSSNKQRGPSKEQQEEAKACMEEKGGNSLFILFIFDL
jgi:troponin T